MTVEKSFKALVRRRMRETGVSFVAARDQLLREEPATGVPSALTVPELRRLARGAFIDSEPAGQERHVAPAGVRLSQLAAHLNSRDAGVRAAAVKVLPLAAGEEAADALLRALGDAARPVRRAAIRSSNGFVGDRRVAEALAGMVLRDEAGLARPALNLLKRSRPSLSGWIPSGLHGLIRSSRYRREIAVWLARTRTLSDAEAELLSDLSANGSEEEGAIAARRLNGYRLVPREEMSKQELDRAEPAWGGLWYWVRADGTPPRPYPSGYDIAAAPEGAWRIYDRANPDPGYGQFDWISARHPDLYHAFSLGSTAWAEEFTRMFDLADLVVVDVGAGTGLSTLGVARTAAKVHAVDRYVSVLEFGRRMVERAGLTNVEYHLAHRSHLPFADESVDVVIAVWAALDWREAGRIIKPGGLVAVAVGGDSEPSVQVDLAAPARDSVDPVAEWEGIPVLDGVHSHQFPSLSAYESPEEAVAMHDRIYGPDNPTSRYLARRGQRTLAHQDTIRWARIRK